MKENPSRTLYFLFKQYKTPIVPYFSISDSLKPQPYFILAFQIEKKTAVTYFSIFNIRNSSPTLILLLNNIRPQPCLSCTLFQHFQKYKTPAVPYFSISNRLKTQPYLILASSSMEENPAAHYFSFLNNTIP